MPKSHEKIKNEVSHRQVSFRQEKCTAVWFIEVDHVGDHGAHQGGRVRRGQTPSGAQVEGEAMGALGRNGAVRSNGA